MKEIINSLSNPTVKELVKLRESARRRRERKRFVAEGVDEILAMVEAGREVETIFHNPNLASDSKAMEELMERCRNKELDFQEMGKDAFGKISYRRNPDGVLAVVHSWSLSLSEMRIGPHEKIAPIIILDEVEKPGNLGAILRTAEAMGAQIVLLSDPRVDFFNPNVIRSSRGLMSKIRVASAGKERVLDWVRARGLKLVGTSSKAECLSHRYAYHPQTAFVFGCESQGLGDFWKGNASGWVRLQMPGTASSLNLNVSVGCILNDFLRATQSD